MSDDIASEDVEDLKEYIESLSSAFSCTTYGCRVDVTHVADVFTFFNLNSNQTKEDIKCDIKRELKEKIGQMQHTLDTLNGIENDYYLTHLWEE